MTAGSPRRTQQRSLETRERLVEAAVEAFATKGFGGATTREIAKRAGVALAALPYHFETKDALWRAAADQIFSLLTQQLASRIRGLEGVDPGTRLRLLLRDFTRFAAHHPELHHFMLHEGAGPSTRLSWLVSKHVRPLFDAFRSQIVEGQARGLVPAGRAEHLYFAFLGAASMPYAVAPEFALLVGESPASEAVIEEHVDLLLRLFVPAAGESAA